MPKSIESTVKPLYIWLVALALLFLASPLLGDARLWGINHLRFLDVIGKIVFIVLTVICFIPSLSKSIHHTANAIQLRYLKAATFTKIIISIIIFAFASICFYLFRNATLLLGDGFLRGDEIGKGFMYLPLSTEPLTAILHYVFFKIVNPLFGISNHHSMQIFSCITGGAFLVIILNIFKPDKTNGISFILPVMGISGIQFYFGYVESYGLMYMGLLLYIWLAFNFLSSGKYFIPACLVFMLTFISHFSTVFALPAHFVLIYFGLRNSSLKSTHKVFALLTLLFMAATYIYFRYVFIGAHGDIKVSYLLPFLPDNYWILAPSHLLDILNNILLSSTLALLMLPSIIKYKLFRNLNFTENIFSVLLSMGSLAFILAMNPKLGFARDWDLFVPAGMVFVIIALWTLKRSKEDISKFSNFAKAGMLLTIIFTASFITVNANLESSYQRYENILKFHTERSAFGYESLGGQYKRFYRNQADLHKAIASYKHAFGLLENPRYLNDIASVYDILLTNSTNAGDKNRYNDSIAFYAEQALNYDRTLVSAYRHLAVSRVYLGDITNAIEYYNNALLYVKADDEADLRFEKAGFMLRMNDWNGAVDEFNKIIEINPKYSKAYAMLGNLYLQLGNKQKAMEYLKKYIKIEPKSELTPQFEDIIRKIGK